MTSPDPMALPAPPALLLFLFGLTFVIHMAFLGLLAASLWARVGAEWGRNTVYLVEPLHRTGVMGFSTTITTGVAPLLFVQVLYGKYFYSSAITIGYPWLAVIVYLLLGFYGLYLWRWRWEKAGGPSVSGKLFLLLSILSVFAIAFTYSWNHLQSLSSTPWAHTIAHTDAVKRLVGYGGGVAVASGAWALWLGQSWRSDRRKPPGATVALFIGALLVGAWTTSSPFAASDWGVSAWLSLLLASGLALGGGVLGLAGKMVVARWLSTLAAAAGLTGLMLQRESLRLTMLIGDYDPAGQLVRMEWGVFVMFAVVSVIGIATLLWLFAQVRVAQRSPRNAS